MKKFTATITAIILAACGGSVGESDVARYVDPFIGTDAHGHTYPGAALPFGMVQLSPDTGVEGWDWCSGYHSSDSTVMGFSHTHLSGTGGADLGDILLMPANGNLLFTPGTKENPDEGYSSRFSHKNERAEAGYYSVYLDDYQIDAELTVTPRTGLHRYSFHTDEPQHIILDLNHGIADMTTDCYYKVIDNQTIEGYRTSRGWAESHTVYFRASFSVPFAGVEVMSEGVVSQEVEGQGTDIVLAAMYDSAPKRLEIQVGISFTSLAGATANLEAERTTFDNARREAKELWNKELSRIKIGGAKDIDKRIFYTSLYHTMLAPVLVSDVDNNYKGVDRQLHNEGEPAYGLFSLWDTFRALHPLFTIIEPTQNQAFIRSILNYYRHSGRLPIWDMNMNEVNCMIGYHAIPVVADAFMKGQRNFDKELALNAMIAASEDDDWNGIGYARTLGYIPWEKEENSVSKALEIAYDDWCIAQYAKELGRADVYEKYIRRAQYYKNAFDPADGFFKGRSTTGALRSDFNPVQVSGWGSGDFTEGNAWQYAFFVPQDVNNHIDMLGGDEKYIAKIDEMFATEGVEGHQSDVTGLIGQYAQGNEPSHQVAYLYAFAGAPWKTQERVAHIMTQMFTAERDGVCGNEDCGQMSAWYVMSAIGFYQVTPASNVYILGTPRFPKIAIELPDGKSFTIEANGLNDLNIYIKSIEYNGKPYTKSYITHDMIAGGGKLRLVMSGEPNKEFGAAPDDRPVSRIADFVTTADEMLGSVVFEPNLNETRRTFNGQTTLHPTANFPIYYTTNGTTPTKYSPQVDAKGIKLDRNTVLKTISIAPDGRQSNVTADKFYRSQIPANVQVRGTAPEEPYTADGLISLFDGAMGGNGYKNRAWLGWYGKNVELEVQLPAAQRVNSISINTLDKAGDWILPPESISVRTAAGAKPIVKNIGRKGYDTEGAKFYTIPVNATTDRLYITLEGGTLPSWHVNGGNNAWIFVDEIVID